MAKNNNETALISDELFMSSLEDVDIWKSEYRNDNVYSHSAFYLPRRIERTYPIDLIVIGLICMISIGGYSYDREYGNQIELLYTQPISRNKYHIKKFFTSFFLSLIVLGLIFIILFAFGLVTEGLGDLNFPIVQYIKDVDVEKIILNDGDYFKLIPIWKYNLRLLISYIFQLAFLCSMGTFISIFVKEK